MDATEIARGLRKPKRTGKRWSACCPAHDDHEPSLDIDDAADGKVLVKCRAGCKQEDVVAALKGLGLWPEALKNGHDKPKHRVVATYDYHDAAGEVVYQVVRFEPKDFRQRRPDPARKGEWLWNMNGVSPVPYRLPRLLVSGACAAIICEGEKDADAVGRLGLVTTTNHGGAGKWRPDLNRWFKSRTVFILAHNDEAGRQHAQQVARNLHGLASSVHVVDLPGLGDKSDAADWIAAGGTAERLQALCRVSRPWEPEQDEAADPAARILSSARFVAGFVAPDYLIDGIVQRRFLYSLTAPTGAGKTAIALRLAAHVALGQSLACHTVEKGRVLYFAGENPDDVRMRWLAMAQHMSFDVETIDVCFIPGTFSIPELEPRIRQELETIGMVDLVIINTSAAYFGGDEENDNVAMGGHARMLRSLVNLPGGPCVVPLCHPVKNAANDNLIPRGGGAYIAEVDGNLVAIKNDTTVELDWQGKLRGPGFDPVAFELLSVRCERVKDSKGRLLPTVIARPLSDREHAAKISAARTDQDTIMIAMLENDGASIATLAEKAEWITGTGKPYRSKVQRVLAQLKKDRIVVNKRGTWTLTEPGKKEAKKARDNTAMAGAKYG